MLASTAAASAASAPPTPAAAMAPRGRGTATQDSGAGVAVQCNTLERTVPCAQPRCFCAGLFDPCFLDFSNLVHAEMSSAILGLGNPLLDISVEVKDLALVERYGLKMGNAILAAAEHAPLYAELVDTFGAPGGAGVQYIAGGATQNSVRVAQWVSGEPAGYAAYVGCVGDDAFGKTLAAAAAADGVTALYQVTADKPTGTCAVIVHEQERSLVANLAAAEALAEAHLDSAAVAAAVASAKVVYCAGFPLTHAGGAASVQRLGKACADTNKVFATNLSAPFIVQVRRRVGRVGRGGAVARVTRAKRALSLCSQSSRDCVAN